MACLISRKVLAGDLSSVFLNIRKKEVCHERVSVDYYALI